MALFSLYGDEENYIFGAGFVSLAGDNCLTSEDVENEVKIYVADEEAYYYEYTEFKLTFNQAWGPLHYVAYDKYVQYSVANYIIQPIIANDNGEYNEALGDVYSYDLGDYCHYVNYDTDFDFDAYGITADMDYDRVLHVYKETIEEQMRSKTAQAKRAEAKIKTTNEAKILEQLQREGKKINSDYTGTRKQFEPGTTQSQKYPNGVLFDENGYARFEEYSVATAKFEFPSIEGTANGTSLNGMYNHDANLAFKQCGLDPNQYTDYVWHHVEDMQTMILVPKDVHSPKFGAFSHTGGASYIKTYLSWFKK